ncbi:hypothetical protein [Phenylobacterium soli]|uniref:Uncharacterized protein n=1 Tax=Phenylobacterium soli TaxID=2170551 RepID=A0A328AAM1_9CAUL|nr:hypothetical protein [Phenylobacterium soli]RAK51625.1 hypothetical protein DJ017_17470 [Phenylobacterium soli]
MTIPSHTTQAADWAYARARGERLPAHWLFCDVCAEQFPDNAFDKQAARRTGFMVCTTCTEAALQSEIHE